MQIQYRNARYFELKDCIKAIIYAIELSNFPAIVIVIFFRLEVIITII